MPDMEKIIISLEKEAIACSNGYVQIPLWTYSSILVVLKKHKPRELTIEEWYEWKANQNRDPICILWEHDTSPMWTLDPNDVHEPALLMGKLKLFSGKPTHEQCKGVKWDA